MNELELKPCPFCGRNMRLMTRKEIDMEIQLIGHDDGAQIICPLMRGIMWVGSVEEAVQLWNRRIDND